MDKLLEIALVSSVASIQLYAMEAYAYTFTCVASVNEYIKANLESTAKIYELLSRGELSIIVLATLAEIIEKFPKSYDYIAKAAKRMALVQARAPYSDLIELFRSEDIDIKLRVMLLINNMLKYAPSDKTTCKFMAQLESLNFYEYLQEASTLRCAELNQMISQFQILAKVVVRTTQFENEALKNRIKELRNDCDRLEEKIMPMAEQQSLFQYLRDEFRSMGSLAKMSVERATLFTPCIFKRFGIFYSYSIESIYTRSIKNNASNSIFLMELE